MTRDPTNDLAADIAKAYAMTLEEASRRLAATMPSQKVAGFIPDPGSGEAAFRCATGDHRACRFWARMYDVPPWMVCGAEPRPGLLGRAWWEARRWLRDWRRRRRAR